MQVYPDQEHLDIEGQFYNQYRNINMNTSSNNQYNNQDDNAKSLLAEDHIVSINTFNEFVKKLQKSTEEFNNYVYSSYCCFLFHLFAKQAPIKLASKNYRKQLNLFFKVVRDFIARENLVKRYNVATNDTIGIVQSNRMLFESLQTKKLFDDSKLDEKASIAQFNEIRANCREELLPTLHLLLLNLIRQNKLKPLQLKYIKEEEPSGFNALLLISAYDIKRQILQEASILEEQRLGFKPKCRTEMSIQEIVDELKRDESSKKKYSVNVRHKTEQSLQLAINDFENHNLNALNSLTNICLDNVRLRNLFATINLLSVCVGLAMIFDYYSDNINVIDEDEMDSYASIPCISFLASWFFAAVFSNTSKSFCNMNNSKSLQLFTFPQIEGKSLVNDHNKHYPLFAFIAETCYMEKVVKDFEESEQTPLILLAALNVCDGVKKYDQFQAVEKERIQRRNITLLSNALLEPDKASSQTIKNTEFYKAGESSLELYNRVLKKIRMHPGGAEDYIKSM